MLLLIDIYTRYRQADRLTDQQTQIVHKRRLTDPNRHIHRAKKQTNGQTN